MQHRNENSFKICGREIWNLFSILRYIFIEPIKKGKQFTISVYFRRSKAFGWALRKSVKCEFYNSRMEWAIIEKEKLFNYVNKHVNENMLYIFAQIYFHLILCCWFHIESKFISSYKYIRTYRYISI